MSEKKTAVETAPTQTMSASADEENNMIFTAFVFNPRTIRVLLV
jgi:hypothetical protein